MAKEGFSSNDGAPPPAEVIELSIYRELRTAIENAHKAKLLLQRKVKNIYKARKLMGEPEEIIENTMYPEGALLNMIDEYQKPVERVFAALKKHPDDETRAAAREALGDLEKILEEVLQQLRDMPAIEFEQSDTAASDDNKKPPPAA